MSALPYCSLPYTTPSTLWFVSMPKKYLNFMAIIHQILLSRLYLATNIQCIYTVFCIPVTTKSNHPSLGECAPGQFCVVSISMCTPRRAAQPAKWRQASCVGIVCQAPTIAIMHVLHAAGSMAASPLSPTLIFPQLFPHYCFPHALSPPYH